MIGALKFITGVLFWSLLVVILAVILACVLEGVLAHLINKMIGRKDD